MSIVSVERSRSIDEQGVKAATFQAIDSAGFRCNKEVDLAVIKPNLCYYWDSTTGETTDPRVVSAIIDYIRERVNGNAKISIVESDASAMRADHAFLMLGYRKLAKQKGVKLENISEGETIDKELVVRNRRIAISLSRTLYEADLVINAPKLKVGPYASGQSPHITCALKNFFGLISTQRKVTYHSFLSETIVAVNKVIKPDVVVTDGIVAKGRYPVRLGAILCGTNNLSVDVIASRILGYDPRSVDHIKLASDEGIGLIEGITLKGEDLDSLQILLPKVNRTFLSLSWKFQLFGVGLYCKTTGDTMPPILG